MSTATPLEFPTERPVRAREVVPEIAVAQAVEAALLWTVLDGRLDWPTALAGHGAFGVLLGAYALWQARRAWSMSAAGPGRGPISASLPPKTISTCPGRGTWPCTPWKGSIG